MLASRDLAAQARVRDGEQERPQCDPSAEKMIAVDS